ncbi:hypothetical protein EDC65_5195 [Stella humosa]|uniref:Porin n=1 Tax=Stella humosa TaxID=94 RepID=A0A3N1KSU6_9PROT|nr:hypothetical protein [Stella humosa]ROP81338.1 hypothetical protein EDC65_5195 [Stella humosa]BBK32688.1 hypothetical protein STHU_33220 [Stella humosa]
MTPHAQRFLVILLLAWPSVGQAQMPSAGADFALGGAFKTEFNLDRIGRRGDRRAYWDFTNKSELALDLSLPAGFSVHGVFKLEPADREPDGSDGFLRAHAAWVDQFYLNWSRGPVTVFAGKIQPRFGFAWDRAPGLYGDDFAEGYELSEKIGAGIRLGLSDLFGTTEIGDHSLQAELFRADRTPLSASLGARRYAVPSTPGRYAARNRRAYGGADNTAGFGNYVLSLAGEAVPLGPGKLDYNLAYSSRRAGEDSIAAATAATERGHVAGVAWAADLPHGITATPLAEWVRLDNADGVDRRRRDVATAGLAVAWAPITLAYTYQWQRDRGDSPARATQHAASASYDLEAASEWLAGFTWTVGWRRLREEGRAANDLGMQLAYGYRF